MTREEKLWSMTMVNLVSVAEKLGVKIDNGHRYGARLPFSDCVLTENVRIDLKILS